jgi:hypothetical protein
MTDPVEQIARAAAAHLAAEHGPTLPLDVEAALHARESAPQQDRYFDPISLGALIVSIASLAWTVYTDLKKKTPHPSRDVVARTVRVRVQDTGGLSTADRDKVIDVVVTETLDANQHESAP